MGAQLERKKEIVADLHGRLTAAQFVVAADYSGLAVADMQGLHKNAGDAGVHVKVYKNTLARRSVDGTPFECITPHLVGQLVLGITSGDPTALAKVFHEFGKEHEPLDLKFGALPQRMVAPEEIRKLADIPSREVLLALLAGTFKAPIAAFARTLAATPAKFARTLAAVRDHKDS